MVSLEKIREEMKSRLSIDKDLHTVEVRAESIDEALADASIQLETKVPNLEYEVLERGSNGFLSIGKKSWLLRIYQNPETVALKKKAYSDELFGDSSFEGENVNVDRDGLFYVRHFGSSIRLKVLLPVGNGRPVELSEVLDAVKRPDTENFDQKAIEKYIKNGTDNGYVTVGTYKHISSADALISVDITKDELHAYITVDAPAMSGAEVTADLIEKSLKAQGVRCGIDDAKISEFVDNPVYSTPFEVATAVMPEDGKDAYVQYNFEIDQDKLKAQESESGNVDFKELNKIQNVVKGQVLATKMPATKGKGGKTLFGHYLEAKNGKDIVVQLGQNCEFEKDGVTIVASVDGQVLFINNKITVEPLLTLDAVNIKSGNVKFVGSVIIKGAVEDGFDVKATGTVDIGGTVGKCNIESEAGDVIIHQGAFGKNEGSLKAGRSLYCKFVQEMKIEVEQNVIATDSLMNCDITAMKNIVVYGKKAQITGGNLFATEEICARTLGSPGGGTTTILTVGVDPRAKKKLDELLEQQQELVKELENLDLDISTLENMKKIRKSLPGDKEETLKKFLSRKGQIIDENKEMSSEIESLQSHLRDLKAVGKVKVEGTVYPGTKIYVRDVLDEVHNEVNGCTFYYENAFAKRGKYEPPSLDTSKGPEGYN
ncbi:MAG: FapA family protein [Treponema sp.]|nr:FapA family protein [Treponema sp.]